MSESAPQRSQRPGLAYVVHSLNPGGTEKLVVEMSLAFAADFSVHVFCLDEPGLWAGDLRAAGIPVSCLWRQPGLDLLVSRRLAKGLRSCAADIVHAHQCTPWLYSALARLAFPKPRLLLEEHGRFFPEVKSVGRRTFGAVVLRRLTHRFVAVSQDVKARLARYEGLNANEIEVIYNGVKPDAPMSECDRVTSRAELGFGPEHFVIGTAGRFDPIKNLEMLVRGIGEAARVEARVRGLLIGDGEQLTAIRNLVDGLDLADRVRFTGFRPDARKLIQCLDLFVLSSFSEGTSLALLEAIAAGVPVAVTGVGGNPEIVVAGETGWVVPSGAVAALAAVILEAARDKALRTRFSVAGRQRFDECFAFAEMISSYRKLYGGLIGNVA